jgi:hypothetical protein
MAKKKSIKVVKVPLDKDELSADRPQAFPKMPRLYLELIENKSKIKQDLINKEYNPSDNNVGNTPPKLEFIEKEKKSNEHSSRSKKDDDFDKRLDSLLESDDDIPKEPKEDTKKVKKVENKSKDSDNDSDDDIPVPKRFLKGEKPKEPEKIKNDDSDSDDEKNEKTKEEREEREEREELKEDKYNDEKSKDKKEEEESDDEEDNTYKKIDLKDKSKDSNYTIKEEISKASSRDNLSGRLKELLNDTDDEKSVERFKPPETPDDSRSERSEYKPSVKEKSVDKYSRYRSKEGKPIPNYKETRTPPTLAELEAKGAYHHKKEMRDINHVSMSEQEEEDAKREMMFKFELLKKSYGNSNVPIPEFSIHSDYNSMKKSYESTVRRLSLDSSVEQYKTYLIGGFMACEFIFGNFLKLDMQGFTQQQILSMHSYEKLLIEIGEKSYVPTGSKWPVELRLLFMIIMNAAFFLVSKMIMKKTGSNLMGMINSLNTVNSTNANAANGGRKRRMKGPDIDLEEIP